MQEERKPDFLESTRVWGRIGLLSFGGPAAQIALMHKVIVEERGWLKEQQFLNALNFCMLLPGPEAMQLATYSGWRLHGVWGGLLAGLLFVVPGAVVILGLAALFVTYGDVSFVSALFFGIKAAVLVIVLEALIRVGRRALNGRWHYCIAAFAFVGLFFLAIPYPLIILVAAVLGFARGRAGVKQNGGIGVSAQVDLVLTVKTIVTWLVIWILPIAVLWTAGVDPILNEMALFFSKLAVVTFGGAYAVLAYMAQDVVSTNQWLTAEEMITGLGLAETTPGPLILVTEFVGFVAAFKQHGFMLGVGGALVTLWVTFVPCFLWIFAGAPYIDWLATRPRLGEALGFITAAVVGVILNLSIWFAIHVLFSQVNTRSAGPLTWTSPEIASIEWQPLLLAMLSGFLLLVRHWNMVLVLTVSALGGVVLSLF